MGDGSKTARWIVAAGLLLTAHWTHAQQAVPLRVDGHEVATLDAGTLGALPPKQVDARAHGDRATWAGVALSDVLARYGVVHGEALRGKALTGTVRVRARDGYVVVFSLGELDPALGDTRVLLVNRRNGQPLDAKLGPWRLVVPDDRRPARWVRNVSAIDVDVPATTSTGH